jgi:hypothetical protein
MDFTGCRLYGKLTPLTGGKLSVISANSSFSSTKRLLNDEIVIESTLILSELMEVKAIDNETISPV